MMFSAYNVNCIRCTRLYLAINTGFGYNDAIKNMEVTLMAFCTSCGKPVDDSASFCPSCGAPTGGASQPVCSRPAPAPDETSTGLKVLSFLIPLVGLILFLVYMDEKPISAKAYGKMALIAVCVATGLAIVIAILASIFAASIFGGILSSVMSILSTVV